MTHYRSHGFSLVELLVVISIIGILSSIVIAALSDSRAQAKDAAIRAEAKSLQLLLEQNYNKYGSYRDLQDFTWHSEPSSPVGWNCEGRQDNVDGQGPFFQKSFGERAKEICRSINKINQRTSGPNVGMNFWLGSTKGPQSYSIMVYLPYSDTYLCIGPSGTSDDTPGIISLNASDYTNIGCPANS